MGVAREGSGASAASSERTALEASFSGSVEGWSGGNGKSHGLGTWEMLSQSAMSIVRR